jgi:hypothetical protein
MVIVKFRNRQGEEAYFNSDRLIYLDKAPTENYSRIVLVGAILESQQTISDLAMEIKVATIRQKAGLD